MNMRKNILLSITNLFFLMTFTSCLTTNILPEKQKGFKSTETEYAEMSNIEVKVNGKKYIQDSILKLYGEKKDDILTVNEIYWFNNWQNGWTEARFAANGKLKIKKTKSKYYEVLEAITIEFPIAAKLRIKDSVLIGDQALKTLQNRLDRITSAIDLLTEENAISGFNHEFIEFPDFEKTIGSILFPEKYGYKRDFIKYSNHNGSKKDKEKFLLRDGTYWNINFTKDVFPEYMWDVRNAGTLYRDWEETMDLFFYLYNWKFFFGQDAKEGSFKKISWKNK